MKPQDKYILESLICMVLAQTAPTVWFALGWGLLALSLAVLSSAHAHNKL